ncbi:MAG TPA: GTP cyclohydrolase I FolE [Myxococcales bacterium]|jgi:GTP cyclohydrolase I|nr:GTP cyclohydrolase I FolE [Myxococcales bacterium]
MARKTSARRVSKSEQQRSVTAAGQPSLPAMERAVASFLTAAGLDPSAHRELSETPALVAAAWAEEFLDGYRRDPRRILEERIDVGEPRLDEMVTLTGLEFQSVCPHHLLPYGGVAQLAYLPGRYVAGFGQIVGVLDCLSHRLVLQEDLAKQVARALQEGLEARGVAVRLEAQQSCMALRGGRQAHARVVTEAFAGTEAQQREIRARFAGAVGSR